MIKATVAGVTGNRTPTPPCLAIEEVAIPADIARSRAQHERARGNSEWLQTHWPDVLPQARGKFLAVAGHEAFVAPTAKEAWAMAEAAHPEYVRPELGPRIYANYRALVAR